MEKLVLEHIGEDSFGRKTYEGKSGKYYKIVDDVLHTCSKDGEPDSPVSKAVQDLIEYK